MEFFEHVGSFMVRDGIAKARGMRNLCRKKLCLVSTDEKFLSGVLYELSKANDCYNVKYSVGGRFGVYMGQCQFTNESATGDAWAKFESHPKVWVTIHDDEFCESYRSHIRSYKDA